MGHFHVIEPHLTRSRVTHAQSGCRAAIDGNAALEPLVGEILTHSHHTEHGGVPGINRLRHGLGLDHLRLTHCQQRPVTCLRSALVADGHAIETAVTGQQFRKGEAPSNRSHHAAPAATPLALPLVGQVPSPVSHDLQHGTGARFHNQTRGMLRNTHWLHQGHSDRQTSHRPQRQHSR